MDDGEVKRAWPRGISDHMPIGTSSLVSSSAFLEMENKETILVVNGGQNHSTQALFHTSSESYYI